MVLVIMAAIDLFINDIFNFITGKSCSKNSHLVKRHNDNLKNCGEFSFPYSIYPWRPYLQSEFVTYENIFKVLFKSKGNADIDSLYQSFVSDSLKWELPISKCNILKDRVCIYLSRCHVFKKCLTNVDMCLFASCKKVPRVLFKCDTLSNEVSDLRLHILHRFAENVSTFNGYTLENDSESDFCVRVFIASNLSSPQKYDYKIIVGTVLNTRNGMRETQYSGTDFIRKRRVDMQLIAEHKFGMRFQSADEKWKTFIDHLGEAASTIELLQVKPSHTVMVNFDDHGNGNTRAAAFVLYNCARLTTLLDCFKRKVQSDIYPPLPPAEQIDFSLLNEEDEWSLLFNYILGFGQTIKQCFEINSKGVIVAPHLLCSFLSSLARSFSIYYRRVRILTEPRPHLVPVLFARIHLLMGLQTVMHTSLKLLNIKPVDHM